MKHPTPDDMEAVRLGALRCVDHLHVRASYWCPECGARCAACIFGGLCKTCRSIPRSIGSLILATQEKKPS